MTPPFAHTRRAQPLCSHTLLKPGGGMSCQNFIFAVHARLLTLHVRYICRTTQQLDCDLATFLLHWISGNHPSRPLGSQRISWNDAPTSRRPVMLSKHVRNRLGPKKRLHAHILLSETGAPALLRCQWHFASVLPALSAPSLAPSRRTLHFAYVSGVVRPLRCGGHVRSSAHPVLTGAPSRTDPSRPPLCLCFRR